MVPIGVMVGVLLGYNIGIMEKKMESTIYGQGLGVWGV